MSEEKTKSASEIFQEFDTCQKSLIHAIFPTPYGSKEGGAKRYLTLYLAPLLITYGILFVLAIITLDQPNLNQWIEGTMQLPFLMGLNWPLYWDMNTAMMFLLTFPLLIVFLVSERTITPQAITSTIDSKVLTVDAETAENLVTEWERRYKQVNIVTTIGGAILGAIVIWANYSTLADVDAMVWGSTAGVVNAAGWYMLFCLALFYFVFSIIVLRSITTTMFLKDLVDHARVRIIPFHPDRSGGLGTVGEIGLRNQYLLSVAGINLLVMAWTLHLAGGVGPILLILVVMLVLAYFVIGPIAFLGPLLPFRQAMKEEKHRLMTLVANRTDQEFQRIEADFKDGVFTQEDSEMISRLQHLGRLLDSLPVWPFDSTTLRKFFAAYVAPLLVALITMFLGNILS